MRIPVVNDTGLPADLPDFKYIPRYTSMSPFAAQFIERLHSEGLMQWAGCQATQGRLPDFASEESVYYHEDGQLQRIQFTPLVECHPDCPNQACKLTGCAPLSGAPHKQF